MSNYVYIGASLDGYIADRNGGLEWLDMVPNTEESDMGYYKFMDGIDALIMGRVTFETVCGFDIEWPYDKPVFVLSNTMKEIPKKFQAHAELINGQLAKVLDGLHKKGFQNLYIDGGGTVQNFLKEDLIDELIITRIPILLGGGAPLFDLLPKHLEFELVDTKVHLGQLVQSHYRRKRT